MKKLLFDPAVMFVDKIYIKDLLDSTRQMIKEKKDKSRTKLRAQRLAIIKEKEKEEAKKQLQKQKELNNAYNITNKIQNINNNNITYFNNKLFRF